MALSVEDKLDIQDLLARYNHAIDAGDAEAWADTFVPDGVFNSERSGLHSGREELMAFAASRPRERGPARHWVNNVLIEGDGDEATMQVYLLLLAVQDEPRPVMSARYEDTLRRVDGQWKFVERRVKSDQPVTSG